MELVQQHRGNQSDGADLNSPRQYLLNSTSSSYNEKVDHFVAADRSSYKNRRSALILTTVLASVASLFLYLVHSMTSTNQVNSGTNIDNYKQQNHESQLIFDQDDSLNLQQDQQIMFHSIESYMSQQEKFLSDSSLEVSLTKGYSWEDQSYRLPLKVSYDMMLQNENGTILMSLYSKTKHSPKPTDSTVDVDAVSWQVSDKSTSSLIRTKLFYEIPPQLNESEVVLERGKIYKIDCVLSEERVAQFIDGQRVTIALITPDQIPEQGHIGFGIMGQELIQPALVGNIQVQHLSSAEAQNYFNFEE